MFLFTTYVCAVTFVSQPVYLPLARLLRTEAQYHHAAELANKDEADFKHTTEIYQLSMQSTKELKVIVKKITSLKNMPNDAHILLALQYKRELDAHKAKYAALFKEADERWKAKKAQTRAKSTQSKSK